jgi:hypothetical protein
VSYGVVSGGERSKSLVCDYGTVYASFVDADVEQFLDQAMNWADPCAELANGAACAGSVARRCSTPAEGERRVLEFDCQSLGLQCVARPDLSVGCAANPT